MAELNTPASANKVSGRFSRNAPAKVDLTAMVDLAFLLITFFMLTTTFAEKKELKVAMPVEGPAEKIADDRSMTICLGKNNKLQWFVGSPENPISPPAVCGFGSKGIRDAIFRTAAAVKSATGKHLIILIKPSDKSNIQNLVDILDEMEIAKVETYAISDLGNIEAERMAKAGLL
jgi:biopolymer transport protein ExbD